MKHVKEIALCLAALAWAGTARAADAMEAARPSADFDAAAAAVPVELPKGAAVFLLMGQSNMAGRADIPPAEKQPLDGAYKMRRDGAWVAAQNPLHYDRAYAALGPGWEFLKCYRAAHPGRPVAVIPVAVGGTSIKTWLPGKENYREAVRRARAAKAQGGVLAGILWHQGETDGEEAFRHGAEEELPQVYAARFKTMIDALRAELDEPALPVVAGEIGHWMRRGADRQTGARVPQDHAKYVNRAVARLPEAVTACAAVSAKGLANRDRHHFNTAGATELGRRYYAAWSRLAEGRDSDDAPCTAR